jgi:asparagine synthase (glutamine-hydrolysing)
MCGIAGFAGPPQADETARAAVQAMCDAITHRGPDDWGAFVEGGVAIGMRRLSIIDVSGGHQPLANEDGTVQVVFNGEIYNHHALRDELLAAGHTFRTRSDTETIVHGYEQWGDKVVERLRGMFTFALWDRSKRRLLVARDRAGIKPLSYRETPTGVAFCSELRSLFALDQGAPTVDPLGVASYLAFGYVADPLSILSGVRKLPPGHYFTWAPGQRVQVTQYWTPARAEVTGISEPDALEEIRRLLDDAVASHLESEVPLGAFLSGGLDSSTVVALMARHARGRVRTFAIGFGEAAFNEAPHARAVAEALGTEHTELVVTPDADALIDDLVAAFDEPFADSSAIPTYLVSELARRQVTVALSGDGGDELFGGYTRYAAAMGSAELPSWLRPAVGGIGRALPMGAFGRNRLIDLGRKRRGRYATHVLFPLDPAEGGVASASLMRDRRPFETALDPWFAQAESRDFLSQMTTVDMLTYLPGDILTKVDRTTMAVSLEARVPLLDHPLMEFALSLPGTLRTPGGSLKALFRKAITPIVPALVMNRPKQGFAVPLAAWLRGPLSHRLEALARPHELTRPYLDAGAVARLVAEHRSGRRDHSAMLWRVLVLDLWMRHLASGRLARATPPGLGAGMRRESAA